MNITLADMLNDKHAAHKGTTRIKTNPCTWMHILATRRPVFVLTPDKRYQLRMIAYKAWLISGKDSKISYLAYQLWLCKLSVDFHFEYHDLKCMEKCLVILAVTVFGQTSLFLTQIGLCLPYLCAYITNLDRNGITA